LKEKTLIIVESPRKASKIQSFLGKNYQVLASYGHIKDLSSNKKYPLGIDLKTFQPRYCISDSKMGVVEALIGASIECDKIILASDPDREGEGIATHLYQILESSGKEIKRAVFHEITEKAIKKALKNPQDLNVDLSEAQQTRRVLDRLIGYCVSPFIQYKQQNLSAGRVQSIALRLMVDKEKEIQKFIPKKYWTVTLSLEKDGQKFEASVNSDKKIDKFDLKSIKVSKITSEIKQKPAKAPFTTFTLLNDAHTKLGYSATKTMQLAQSLYEDGFISYMRTDSVRVSDDSITEARRYLEENNLPLPNLPNKYSNKNGAQDAHEAVKPTSIDAKPEDMFFSADLKELYQLIYEKFIASQSIPAKISNITAEFKHEKMLFKAKGKTILDKGWTVIYTDSEKENFLPNLVEGEDSKVLNVFIKEKETSPPARFNERTLIEDLEKKLIGRPSTYASIIPKLLEKGYITQKKDTLTPTEVAIEVIDKLVPYFSFMNFDYTANLEAKLDQIAEGKQSYFDTIYSFWNSFNKELSLAYAQTTNKSERACNKCKSLTEKFVYGGICYFHCVNFPTCDFKFRYREDDPTQSNMDEHPYQPCKKCGFYTRLITSSQYGDYWVCARGLRCR
jgi:DNA topoisomerase-1